MNRKRYSKKVLEVEHGFFFFFFFFLFLLLGLVGLVFFGVGVLCGFFFLVAAFRHAWPQPIVELAVRDRRRREHRDHNDTSSDPHVASVAGVASAFCEHGYDRRGKWTP